MSEEAAIDDAIRAVEHRYHRGGRSYWSQYRPEKRWRLWALWFVLLADTVSGIVERLA